MIEYEEDWLFPLLFQKEGSVAIRASYCALPSAALAVLLAYLEEFFPGTHDMLGLPDLATSYIWNIATSLCMILLGFRTKTAFSRFWEGTGLLHQMRGEWFDTVSNCVTFSIAAKPTKPDEVHLFRHALVRLMSLCHGSALEEIAGNEIELECIDVGGLNQEVLLHLQECDSMYGFNKVEVMLHLVQSLITKALDDGVLKVAPPICSRVYQTISRGFVNLLNAKKITDTKFPFPFAQTISFLLILLCFLTPIMIVASPVRTKLLAALLTFVPLFGMASANFIAAELEDPFGTDDNDLPLDHFQEEMNRCLLMLVHPNTDLISGISTRCMLDFHELLQTCGNGEHRVEGTGSGRLSAYDVSSMPGMEFLKGEEIVKKERLTLAVAKLEALHLPELSEQELLDLALQETTRQEPEIDEEELRIQREIHREQVSIRLEAAQREVEKRMGEYYLALQRWALSIERQVKQLHEVLEVLRLLSESAEKSKKSEGWEHVIPML